MSGGLRSEAPRKGGRQGGTQRKDMEEGTCEERRERKEGKIRVITVKA